MYNYEKWAGYINAWELAEPATREEYRKSIWIDCEEHKGEPGWEDFDELEDKDGFIEWIIDQLAKDGYVK